MGIPRPHSPGDVHSYDNGNHASRKVVTAKQHFATIFAYHPLQRTLQLLDGTCFRTVTWIRAEYWMYKTKT